MKLLENAKIRDIKSLITNGNTLNVGVKFYQRPYKWRRKKITDLFEDYKENAITAFNEGSSYEYYIGAVVLVDERDENERNSNDEQAWNYQIVDGQQRFTTLFLFNYIKYMLLIRQVAEAAKSNISTDFIDGLNSIESCYKGYIGKKNAQIIIEANEKLRKAFDTANQNHIPIKIEDLNEWRIKIGWIKDPDITDDLYFTNCRDAMATFLTDEEMCIDYENSNFNKIFKDALSNIVFMFSDASEASFCIQPIVEYIDEYDEDDEDDERQIDFPYIRRAYDIFDKIKRYHKDRYPDVSNPYEKLTGYIKLIDEMLKNIKLCMIVTSDEDDAYKLFEALNDRSESVTDLELLKNYFFKAYTVDSSETETQSLINSNIMRLDNKWREIFFSYEELEPELFEYMTVFFTGKTGKYANERKRKLIRDVYFSKYNSSSGLKYTYNVIKRDFSYIEYIYKILLCIHRFDNRSDHKKSKDEDPLLSLYIENDPNASVVKRALGIAINLQYSVVSASLICDIIHNYEVNVKNNSNDFSSYLNDIFNENRCKDSYLGLWEDANLLWKVIILSKDFKTPKIFSDKLAEACNINKIEQPRQGDEPLISFDSRKFDEKSLNEEFDEWINEWKFTEPKGKIKIKNLFMHMYLKYDYDSSTDKLVLSSTILRQYAEPAIKQDLDHMDANRPDRRNGNGDRYFHYGLTDRSDYINRLGNMIPLPIKINRGKHNLPMEETIKAFSSEGLDGWIFKMVESEFAADYEMKNNYKVPKVDFFTKRKDRLIDFFKRVVANQLRNPKDTI